MPLRNDSWHDGYDDWKLANPHEEYEDRASTSLPRSTPSRVCSNAPAARRWPPRRLSRDRAPGRLLRAGRARPPPAVVA